MRGRGLCRHRQDDIVLLHSMLLLLPVTILMTLQLFNHVPHTATTSDSDTVLACLTKAAQWLTC